MRRRFQFNLGTLFWVTFIVAFFCGIWGFRSKLDFIRGSTPLIANAQRCLKRGDLDKALAFADRAVQCSPELCRTYDARAEVLEARGDFREAIRDYTRVASLGEFNALADRGRVYEKMGERDKAAADYCEAVLSDGMHRAYSIGIVAIKRARKPGDYWESQRYPKAVPSLLKFIDEAIERLPDNRDLRKCRELILRSGRITKAG